MAALYIGAFAWANIVDFSNMNKLFLRIIFCFVAIINGLDFAFVGVAVLKHQQRTATNNVFFACVQSGKKYEKIIKKIWFCHRIQRRKYNNKLKELINSVK